MKQLLTVFALLMTLIGPAAGAGNTIFDINTTQEFNDTIVNSTDVKIVNDTASFNDSTTGEFTLQKYEVESHDNLTVEAVSNSSATVSVTGYNSSGTQIDQKNFSLSNGTNTFNTTGLNGTEFDVKIDKTATGNLEIQRLTYKGTLPDSGLFGGGGNALQGSVYGVKFEHIGIGALAVLALLVIFW